MLPQIEDPDGDDVTTTVDVQSATFVTFDSGELNIADLSLSTVQEGEYQINVTLDDSRDSNSYNITLNIMPALSEEIDAKEEELTKSEES